MPPIESTTLQPVADRVMEQGQELLAGLPMFVVALAIVWLAWRFGGWLSRRQALQHVADRNPFLRELARTTVRWLILLAGVLIALEILEATALVGAVLGTAGVLGVAIGFAFKDILENYIAGILMSLRQPFAPRDHVVIDGNEGVIVALNSRATILMTLDGNHLRLPNALVFRSVTLNYTRNPSRRFHFEVGIGVEEDLVEAQEIGVRELQRIDGILADPPPRAMITALGDSNVQVRYQAWVDQRSHDFLLVKSESIRRVKLALEDAGMDMPEPIYRVQMSERKPSTAKDAKPVPDAAREHAVDTRARDDLDPQIDEDRDRHGGDDLLDATAPRE
ncbi:mechanosensitive ion channel family protein [Luteimonas vadosa]|uniref:Small-conductance mechanosensitive channel n=1 Tax=Luteimonas vadosa TaxID=1165507 RepID=A0ABP9E3U3_9GAMM